MRRSGKGGQTKCLREKPSFALPKNTEKRPHRCYFAIIRKQRRRYTKSVHENRIKENIDIFDFSLTEEEKQELAARDKNEPIIGKPKRLDFTEVAMTWGDNETDSKAICETSPTNFRKHFRCESQ